MIFGDYRFISRFPALPRRLGRGFCRGYLNVELCQLAFGILFSDWRFCQLWTVAEDQLRLLSFFQLLLESAGKGDDSGNFLCFSFSEALLLVIV